MTQSRGPWDEILSEFLKALIVVQMLSLIRLCTVWKLGILIWDWLTGVVVPLFKKGDWRVFQLQGSHTPLTD